MLINQFFRPHNDTSQMTVDVNIQHCGHIRYQRKLLLRK